MTETPSEPAHIIHSSNGRTYDLTQNEIRNDLLPGDVLNALKDWPHGWEYWHCGRWVEWYPNWSSGATYRAKPAPDVKEYVLYWEADLPAMPVRVKGDTHRITIRDDGTGKISAEVEALK